MQKETMTLKPNAEFVELIKVLKFKQIAQTGGHAKLIIEDGFIYVNGEQEFRKRRKLRAGDVVIFEDVSVEILAN